jgi:plastocyanin
MKTLLAGLLGVAIAAIPCIGLAANFSVTVVDKDGKPVPDAVVVVKTEAKGQPREPLPMAATVNQARMRFSPAMTIVPVGAQVKFVNEDPFDHHVRGSLAGAAQFTATEADGFVLRLDAKAPGKAAAFEQKAMTKVGPLMLTCHIHQSMRGFVYVTDSPWTRLTGADGSATFEDMPAGAALVRAWTSEQLVELPADKVTVGSAAQQMTLRLPIAVKPRR